jgi:hypothetical protein
MTDIAVESDLGSDPSSIAHKKWKGFLVLGLALFIGGACSVAVPAVSTYAKSTRTKISRTTNELSAQNRRRKMFKFQLYS